MSPYKDPAQNYSQTPFSLYLPQDEGSKTKASKEMQEAQILLIAINPGVDLGKQSEMLGSMHAKAYSNYYETSQYLKASNLLNAIYQYKNLDLKSDVSAFFSQSMDRMHVIKSAAAQDPELAIKIITASPHMTASEKIGLFEVLGAGGKKGNAYEKAADRQRKWIYENRFSIVKNILQNGKGLDEQIKEIEKIAGSCGKKGKKFFLDVAATMKIAYVRDMRGDAVFYQNVDPFEKKTYVDFNFKTIYSADWGALQKQMAALSPEAVSSVAFWGQKLDDKDRYEFLNAMWQTAKGAGKEAYWKAMEMQNGALANQCNLLAKKIDAAYQALKGELEDKAKFALGLKYYNFAQNKWIDKSDKNKSYSPFAPENIKKGMNGKDLDQKLDYLNQKIAEFNAVSIGMREEKASAYLQNGSIGGANKKNASVCLRQHCALAALSIDELAEFYKNKLEDKEKANPVKLLWQIRDSYLALEQRLAKGADPNAIIKEINDLEKKIPDAMDRAKSDYFIEKHDGILLAGIKMPHSHFLNWWYLNKEQVAITGLAIISFIPGGQIPAALGFMAIGTHEISQGIADNDMGKIMSGTIMMMPFVGRYLRGSKNIWAAAAGATAEVGAISYFTVGGIYGGINLYNRVSNTYFDIKMDLPEAMVLASLPIGLAMSAKGGAKNISGNENIEVQYRKVLGVDENATYDQIQSAYRTLSKKYHPDKNSSPEANDKFVKIREAYTYLYEPYRQAKYDEATGKKTSAGMDEGIVNVKDQKALTNGEKQAEPVVKTQEKVARKGEELGGAKEKAIEQMDRLQKNIYEQEKIQQNEQIEAVKGQETGIVLQSSQTQTYSNFVQSLAAHSEYGLSPSPSIAMRAVEQANEGVALVRMIEEEYQKRGIILNDAMQEHLYNAKWNLWTIANSGSRLSANPYKSWISGELILQGSELIGKQCAQASLDLARLSTDLKNAGVGGELPDLAASYSNAMLRHHKDMSQKTGQGEVTGKWNVLPIINEAWMSRELSWSKNRISVHVSGVHQPGQYSDLTSSGVEFSAKVECNSLALKGAIENVYNELAQIQGNNMPRTEVTVGSADVEIKFSVMRQEQRNPGYVTGLPRAGMDATKAVVENIGGRFGTYEFADGTVVVSMTLPLIQTGATAEPSIYAPGAQIEGQKDVQVKVKTKSKAYQAITQPDMTTLNSSILPITIDIGKLTNKDINTTIARGEETYAVDMELRSGRLYLTPKDQSVVVHSVKEGTHTIKAGEAFKLEENDIVIGEGRSFGFTVKNQARGGMPDFEAYAKEEASTAPAEMTPLKHATQAMDYLQENKLQEAADSYALAAEGYAAIGKYTSAGELYQYAANCLEGYGRNAEYAALGGAAYFKAGDLSSAASMTSYAADHETDPAMKRKYAIKACEYYGKFADEYMQSGNYQSASWYYNKAMEYAPNDISKSEYASKLKTAQEKQANDEKKQEQWVKYGAALEFDAWYKELTAKKDYNTIKKAGDYFAKENPAIAKKIAGRLLVDGHALYGVSIALELGKNGDIEYTKFYCKHLVEKGYYTQAIGIANTLYESGYSDPLKKVGETILHKNMNAEVAQIAQKLASEDPAWALKMGKELVLKKEYGYADEVAQALTLAGHDSKGEEIRVETRKAHTDPLRLRYFGQQLNEQVVQQHMSELDGIWKRHPNIENVREYQAFVYDVIEYAKKAGAAPEVLEAGIRFSGGSSNYNEAYAVHIMKFSDYCLKACEASGMQNQTVVNIWRDGFFFQIAQQLMVPEGGPTIEGITFSTNMLDGGVFGLINYSIVKSIASGANEEAQRFRGLSKQQRLEKYYEEYDERFAKLCNAPMTNKYVEKVYKYIKNSGCVKLDENGKVAPQYVLFTDTGYLSYPPFLKAVLEYGSVQYDGLKKGEVQADIYFVGATGDYMPQYHSGTQGDLVNSIETYTGNFGFSEKISNVDANNQALLSLSSNKAEKERMLKKTVAFIIGMQGSIKGSK